MKENINDDVNIMYLKKLRKCYRDDLCVLVDYFIKFFWVYYFFYFVVYFILQLMGENVWQIVFCDNILRKMYKK